MGKRFLIGLIFILTLISTLTGCSSEESEWDFDVKGDDKVIYELEGEKKETSTTVYEDGMFYVRHSNGRDEPVYFGYATFNEGSTSNTPDNGRVMWFKDDFENIPTLYAGDSLIYYTKDILEEEFNYERFYDYGYSIGICGLEPSTSGRYKISTEVDDNNTYPGGDTDVLLTLNNDELLLDKIGGEKVRENKNNPNDSFLTQIGSIAKLKEGGKYTVEIYEGTIQHNYTFTADVRLLGSVEVVETNDYTFQSDNVICLNIPQEFNNGYYLINGIGVFRYVSDNTAYDENTNFNIPNSINEKENEINYRDDEEPFFSSANNGNDTSPSEGTSINNIQENSTKTLFTYDKTSTFNIIETGEVTVYVSFSVPADLIGDGLPDVSANITSPSGHIYSMRKNNEGLYLTLEAEEVGTYTIGYRNLDVRVPKVVVSSYN